MTSLSEIKPPAQKSVAFIACVESGYLENQTMLLCRSIRRYAGRYRNAPIYTFQPRRGTAIGRDTLAVLNELGVVHDTRPLNVEFHTYAIANKILCSAWAEENLRNDTLVFVDSDTIMTGEPSDLDLSGEVDGAARPCNRWEGGISSIGPGDPNEPYWQRVYASCGLTAEPFVESVVDRKRVRAYFSSGLVAVIRDAGLFAQWREDFFRLVRAGHIPDARRIRQMDEISLAATFGRVFDRVRVLDWRYNYLLYRRPELGSPAREAQLEDLIHVHYRFWFNQPGYLHRIQPSFIPSSEIIQWLDRYLPFQPLVEGPMPSQLYSLA
jgi:hypothetical protein